MSVLERGYKIMRYSFNTHDYDETLEQEKDEIINALYYLKAFAENPYNDTMFKTFASLLYTLTETY